MNCELLKKIRTDAGFTQEEMARRIGYLDKSSYCLLENGSVKCTVERARMIKDALNLSFDQYNKIFLAD